MSKYGLQSDFYRGHDDYPDRMFDSQEQEQAYIDKAIEMAKEANSLGDTGICKYNNTNSQEAVFYLEGPYAVCAGHIYSEAGRAEYQRNTGWCEYHFDKWSIAFDSGSGGW